MSKNYALIAQNFAKDVVNFKIPACAYIQLACQRHLDDLTKDWDYFFNPDLAGRVCKFIELMPHIKGKWVGSNLCLEPWQVFIVAVVFGWVDKNGCRRFKTAYIEVPRKNAKSTLSSGVGIYCLVADNEAGSEVYSVATTREQAQIVWGVAKKMVDKSPGLRQRFGVKTSAYTVYTAAESGIFKALSRDQGGNLDGLNVHCGIIDELHAHKTRDMFDVMETGTGSRTQPLIWLITTAGFNRSGICYEQRSYTIKVLSGVEQDEEYFGLIYTIDDNDDWTSPAVWEKANPNWGKSVNPDDIARKARKAMAMASAQNNFLTKHLNVWVNADILWMDMRALTECQIDIVLEDFSGESCWMGLDLATKKDIASLALLFKRGEKYFGFLRNYINRKAVDDGRNSQYSGWEYDNYLVVTPGNTTDFSVIEHDIIEYASMFNIECVGYDPWQAEYVAQRLADKGLLMVECRQIIQNMSEPMKQLEALVLSTLFFYNGDPVFTWMMSNVVAHLDAKDNIYPRKEFPENKIDGVIAMIMALGRAMVVDAGEVGSIYDSEDMAC